MDATPRGRPIITPSGAGSFSPPNLTKIEDTGLSQLWLQDLALKILYFQGYLSGFKMAEEMTLPFTGLVDQILEALKREKFVEVKSSQIGLGEGAYLYAITGAGIARAREALERSQYAGPAPVPIEVYNESVLRQARSRTDHYQPDNAPGLSHLVLSEATFQRIGPAVNSGTSIFLIWPPRKRENQHCTLHRQYDPARKHLHPLCDLCRWAGDQVVRLGQPPACCKKTRIHSVRGLCAAARRDPRWVQIRRPFMVVGGELTLAGLDLVFDDVHKFYEAPFQVKANGGILLIDDFGRQLVRPRDLLNRWIVPLENRLDFLTLHTGRKIEVPFDVLVVFSTNLPPHDLVDEAFLRRLRHKIEISDPDYDEYREIFRRVAAAKGVTVQRSGIGLFATRMVYQAQP